MRLFFGYDNIGGLYRRMPMHHKDPFARMIISQAIAEQIPVVTADSEFGSYVVTHFVKPF